jgi:hypothetical protein
MVTPPIAANATDQRADFTAPDADILEHPVVEHHQMARGPLALAPGKERRDASTNGESEGLHGDVNGRSIDIVSVD